MHPDRIQDEQMSEVQRLLALRPAPPPPDPIPPRPAPPAQATPAARDAWTPPGYGPGWPSYKKSGDAGQAGEYDAVGGADDEYDDDVDDDDDEYDEYDEYDDDDEYDDEAYESYGPYEPYEAYEEARGTYRARRVPQAAPKRRGPARYVLLALALTGISFGAVRLLANRTNQGLAMSEANSPAASSPAHGTQPGSTRSTAAGTTSFATFPGYPGQQGRDGGQLAINSVAAANGEQVAAGSADGYPAIWRQGPGNAWSLAAGAANGVLAGRPGVQTLTAVTQGPSGWLAVGGVVSGAAQHPVVVTSADGETWQAADGAPAFAGEGLYAYGATAGQIDYVIVGEQVTGNTTTAATWWSDGLSGWQRGGNGGLTGVDRPSEMFAVTVGPDRFIAVGAHGSQPAVWTSLNAQQWTVADLPLPAGAVKAALRQVVAHGSLVVAAGNAEMATGTVPFVEVSDDNGATWHEAALPSSGSEAVVTALTASGGGFTIAGQIGQGSKASAVVWTSGDGGNWTAATTLPGPAGSGGGTVTMITGLTSAGNSVRGIGAATTKAGDRPVVYTAPAG